MAMRNTVVLSRAKLYELVWSEPATKVAANKKVTRARLPRPREGDERVMLNHGWRSSNGQAVSDGHASKRAEPVVAQREFEAQPENKIVVDMEKARRGAWARELNSSMRQGANRYDDGVDIPRHALSRPRERGLESRGQRRQSRASAGDR